MITTVSSPEKANLAAQAGADHVIDYRQQDVVAEVRKIAPDGVDTIVEVAAAANAEIDSPVIGLHGSVAVYADDGGAPLSLPVRPLMVPNARWQFVLVYTAPHDGSGARSTTSRPPCSTERCGSARTPACRCTTSRSSTRPTPTPRSRAERSARCWSTSPTRACALTAILENPCRPLLGAESNGYLPGATFPAADG